MDQHWFKRLGGIRVLTVLLFGGLGTSAAIAVEDDAELDPPPGDFWGHVDIPEIGIGIGGNNTNDTKNLDPWGVLTAGDDLLGLRLSHGSTSLKNGVFAVTADPPISITVDSGVGSISPEAILKTNGALSSDLGILSTLPGSGSTIGDGSKPSSSSAIPTPGAGVLLIGGLVLLGSRRRRSS